MLGAPFKPSLGLSGITALNLPLPIATPAFPGRIGFITGVLTQTLTPVVFSTVYGPTKVVPLTKAVSFSAAPKNQKSARSMSGLKVCVRTLLGIFISLRRVWQSGSG